MNKKETYQYLRGIWDSSHINPSDEQTGQSLFDIDYLSKKEIVKKIISHEQLKNWGDLFIKIETTVKAQLKSEGFSDTVLSQIEFFYEGWDPLIGGEAGEFDIQKGHRWIEGVSGAISRANEIWEK